jgi:hypothetical protein
VTQQNLTGAVVQKSAGVVQHLNETDSPTPQRDDTHLDHASKATRCVLSPNQTQANARDTAAPQASVATREPAVATVSAAVAQNEAPPLTSPLCPTSELGVSNLSVFVVLKNCIVYLLAAFGFVLRVLKNCIEYAFAAYGFLMFCLWVTYWWLNEDE